MTTTNDITAVVLAGGQGTRLQPYTAMLPKPLVPIGDRPIVEILLSHLKRAGVRRVILAVNHLSHLITAVLGDGSRLGLEIEYSLEREPLSTVGPLKLIPDLPDRFVVANGDILSDIDIAALFRQHQSSNAVLTVACTRRTELLDFGVIETDDTGRVASFFEKPRNEYLVSMGIYVFSRRVLEFVPSDQAYGFDQLMHDLLEAGQPIATRVFDGYWLDIGRVSDYERAQLDIEKIKKLGL